MDSLPFGSFWFPGPSVELDEAILHFFKPPRRQGAPRFDHAWSQNLGQLKLMSQWPNQLPFQEPKSEVLTIYKAYVKGLYHQDMTSYGAVPPI